MNLLHRYIFKQLLIATIMAVTVFVFVMVLGNFMREVLDLLASGRLDWGTFLHVLALLIPGVLPYALPLGLLTAVLLVVGRLCAQNEYTAMRSAGLSLWTLVAPVMLLSCLGVLLLLFINFFYAPSADRSYKRVVASLARRNPLQFFQPGYYVRDFPNHIIYVGGRDGDNLRDIWIWELDKKGEGHTTGFVRAESGQLDYDPVADALVLKLHNGIGESYNSGDPQQMQDTSQPSVVFKDAVPRVFSLSELTGPPPVPSKLSLLSLPELLAARNHPTAANITPMLVQMQIQSRLVGAFSVLALTLVGLPLALRVGRAENFVNLALALGLALGQYLMIVAITLLHNHPAFRPDLLLWLPNFGLEALGVWLLLRAAKR